MLRSFAIGAVLSCILCGVAFAQEAEVVEPAVDAYGYTLDDVAVNQGIVLYWYAYGYANCYGCPPQTYADMQAKGLPLRKFMSPHTGDEIDPDDGSLDFDGDMIYKLDPCYSVQVDIQTSKGVVKLPGLVCAESNVGVQFDPCCCIYPCPGSLCIAEYGWDYWGICDSTDCACKVVQWMMWKSFETHECLFGARPADELAWYASGLAPIDKNYKEYVPYMDIEFIYKGDAYCCFLKKAYVNCCEPCPPCPPCPPAVKSPCDPCNPCPQKCGSCASPCAGKCSPCKQVTCTKPKCDPCNPCPQKCGSCAGPCKSKCDPCKPVAKSKCGPCEPKCGPTCKQVTCTKPKCDPCTSACEPKCDPCKPACKSKCNPCETKCERRCAPKCDSCS